MPAQRPSRWRAFFIRLLVLLSLGAVTTVAVSWTLAKFVSIQGLNGRYIFDDGEHVWRITSLDGIGAVSFRWWCNYRWKESATPDQKAALIAHLTKHDPNEWFGRWRRLPESIPRPRLRQLQSQAAAQIPSTPQDISIPVELRELISSVTEMYSSTDVYFGLPLPALRYTLERSGSSEEYIRGALALENSSQTQPWKEPQATLLPLIPVVSGFASNTTFYAAIWTLPYLTYLGVRRFRTRRRRRGQCPKCAYDLQHKFLDGCPKCQWNRTPTSRKARRRRTLRGFAVRLALGGLVTVGVAWTAALVKPSPASSVWSLYDDGTYIWTMIERSNPFCRAREWHISWRWRDTASPAQREEFIEYCLSPESSINYTLFSESLFRSRKEKLDELNARFGSAKPSERLAESRWGETLESYGGIELTEMDSGWPAFAMKSSTVWTGNTWELKGAFVTNENNSFRALLPYHIIPLGFLINTALVTSLLYLPRASRATIRSIRKRRGRCPACANPLGENAPTGCPACGWKPAA